MNSRESNLLMLLLMGASLVGCGPSQATQSGEQTSVSVMLPFDLSNARNFESGETAISEIDGMELVYVPEGAFLMGLSEEDIDQILHQCGSACDGLTFSTEQPQHDVYLDEYWIDRTEITNEMYAAFLNSYGNQCEGGEDCLSTENSKLVYSEGEWHSESNYSSHPVSGVTWYGAQAYCGWAGRRLPTEAEWEKAASGEDGRLYPWGDVFTSSLANTYDDPATCSTSSCDGYEGTSPAGSFPEGASPYGVLDMLGNVEEWVADRYNDNYYIVSPAENPLGPSSGDFRVFRGGSYSRLAHWPIGAADRFMGDPYDHSTELGFRCAYSAHSSARGFKLTFINMIDAVDGWGLNNATIFTTQDGGKTWHDVTPLPEYRGDTSYRVTAGFLDADHAWVVYTTIGDGDPSCGISSDTSVLFTTDGGQNWKTSQPLEIMPSGLVCEASFNMIDTKTGWLRIFERNGEDPVAVNYFRTIDGGLNWNPVIPTWCDSADSCGTNPEIQRYSQDIVFVDEQTGWLLDWSVERTAPGFYVTSDGGFTWHTHELSPPTQSPELFTQWSYCLPSQLNLLSEEVARLKVSCFDDPNFEDPRSIEFLYATEDGGITWHTHTLPTVPFQIHEIKTRLLFFDEYHGLLLSREMWRTEDGGVTWQNMNIVSWDGQFSFINPWRGWAIAMRGGITSLVDTTYCGKNWRLMDIKMQPTADRLDNIEIEGKPRSSDLETRRFVLWEFHSDDTVRVVEVKTLADWENLMITNIFGQLLRPEDTILSVEWIGSNIMDEYTYEEDEYLRTNYFVETNSRRFGYDMYFDHLPHLRIQSDDLRLITLGIEPKSYDQEVIAVAVPIGMEIEEVFKYMPYKQITLDDWNIFYYDTTAISGTASIRIRYRVGEDSEKLDARVVEESR